MSQQTKRNIGSIVAVVTLMLSMIASWSHFYSEQKINTLKIQMAENENRKIAGAVYDLQKNQILLLKSVESNKETTVELKENFKEMFDVLNKNQVVIAKIAGKVGVDELED